MKTGRFTHPLEKALHSWINECNKRLMEIKFVVIDPNLPKEAKLKLIAERKLTQSRVALIMSGRLQFTGVSRPGVIQIDEAP